jgi:hypothetical protein
LPPDTITYRAVYGVEVRDLSDFPAGEGYERRTVTQRDLIAHIRERYIELKGALTDALDRFVIERAKRALTN